MKPPIAALPDTLFAGLRVAYSTQRERKNKNYIVLLPGAGRTLAKFFSCDQPENASPLEQLALLLGRPYHAGNGGLCLVVEETIPVLETEGGGAFVKAAGNWLAQLENAMETLNQGRCYEEESFLLATAHTHPGIGVFLSGRDKRSHDNLFPDYGASIVVDPMRGRIGAFTRCGQKFKRSLLVFTKEG